MSDHGDDFARPRVASGVLYFDGADRVMIVKPTYKPLWDIPGGYAQPGEAPAAAALREVVEELGVRLPVGPLLVVDWAPHPAEGDKLLFVFDGGDLSSEQIATVRVDGAEIGEFAFRCRAELDGLLVPRLARRVSAAIGARAAGGPVYLERGAEQPRGA